VTTRYLLPCSCGRQVSIEPRQAGGVVQCECGASLAVPTMLEMAALEQSDPEPAPPRPGMHWGVRQSVVLLGGVIFLSGLGLGTYLLLTPPKNPGSPSAEEIRREVQAYSPARSLEVWRMVRASGLHPFEPTEHKDYRQAVFTRRLWIGVASLIALAGLGLMLTPLLIQRHVAAARKDQAG
jgi:hypothetical protein